MSTANTEFEAFQSKMQGQLQTVEGKAMEQLLKIEQNCLEKSNNNVEKFVSCMNDATKAVERAEKRFEYKIAFIQNWTLKCLQKNNTAQNYQECKKKGADDVQSYLDDFLKDIQKQ